MRSSSCGDLTGKKQAHLQRSGKNCFQAERIITTKAPSKKVHSTVKEQKADRNSSGKVSQGKSSRTQGRRHFVGVNLTCQPDCAKGCPDTW